MENHHLFFMGKSTISMAIFNSYVKLPEGNGYSTPLMFASPGFNKWILGEPEQEPRKHRHSERRSGPQWTETFGFTNQLNQPHLYHIIINDII